MINTYQTSLAPPAVPPRLHSSHGVQPMLIPTPLPQGQSKTLMRFMVIVVLLNLLMTVVGIVYLYINSKQVQQGTNVSSEGTGPHLSMQTQQRKEGPESYLQKHESSHSIQEASVRAFAQMVFQVPSKPPKPKPGYLEWDMKHCRYSYQHVNYYNSSWLTIETSGDYSVYSRITFSSGHSKLSLINRVMLRKTKTDKDKEIMKAYCHLDRSPTKPSLCTATTQDVFKLEKGNQLSVWTEDMSLVDYDPKATAFGLYSIW